MNDRDAKIAIRDLLRDKLEDPMTQYEEGSRAWIHTDIPLTSAKHPRIQIIKRGPTNVRILTLGYEYWEHRSMVFDVFFYTKTGFKWNNGVEDLSNEELVDEYLSKIWRTIKANGKSLHDNYGISGASDMGDDPGRLEFGTQLYRGAVSVSVEYFFRK